MTNVSRPRVLVLLGTLNGEDFLDEQLSSLVDQSIEHIDVHASDDGSIDSTQAILQKWASFWPKGNFTVCAGPANGFAENYRHLILSAAEGADYYAFCDQDDIWLPKKLEVAIERLASLNKASPALYASRTSSADVHGNKVGLSPLMPAPPSFRNALVQSIAGANTMVMDTKAFFTLRRASAKTKFVSHDWWSYALITGAGGQVFYDRQPHILYRQHTNNVIGTNTGTGARMRRVGMLLTSRFERWMDVHIGSLIQHSDLLANENAELVERFANARKKSGIALSQQIFKDRIYRQTMPATFSLYAAALLGRF